MRRRTTLFWKPEGPKIAFEEDYMGHYFVLEDLNPQMMHEFRMDPMELLKFGFTCIWRAMFR